jgi:peptide/nickel transport system permease protein
VRFLRQRAARLVPVLLIVTFFSYVLLDLLPGDPAVQRLGQNATAENVAELRHELGLDEPLPVRYVKWVGNALHGDLGESYVNGQPVARALEQRAGVTIELLVVSQLIALGIAVPLALLAARRPGKAFDRITTGTAFAFMAVPDFILAVVFVLIFAVDLHWFPSTGLPPFRASPIDHVRSLVLPTVSLAMGSLATYLRVLRAELITTLQEDFVLNARARGLPDRWIMVRHALRPSSISLTTVAGLITGALIGGTLIIEVIFVLPGMGSLAVQAIHSRDYPMVQGFVVVVGVAYVLLNFVVDALYALLDPRIRTATAKVRVSR